MASATGRGDGPMAQSDARRIPSGPTSANPTAAQGETFRSESSLPERGLPAAVREAISSPGIPLDAETRSSMGSRFGHDFASVRIHATPQAAASAAMLHAHAYTVGNHVVLGAAAPRGGSLAGRLLMAHELAHVVQQRGDGPRSAPALDPDAGHERDARAAAFAALAGTRPVRVTARTGVGVAREPSELRQVLLVARDLMLKELDEVPETLADLEKGLRTISQGSGPSADAAGRFLGRLEGDLRVPASHLHLRQTRQAAENFLRRNMPSLPNARLPHREVETTLGLLEKGGGEAAGEARKHLDAIEQARERVQQLELAKNPPQAFASPKKTGGGSGRGSGPASGRSSGGDWTKDFRQDPTKPGPSSTSTSSSSSTSGGATTSGTGKTESVVTEAASDVKSTSRLGRAGAGTLRLAKTLGTVGFHLLLPGPLDAIALMAQFAGSYAQAHEAIRDRNTRAGFRLGLASRLLGRSGAAVREHFARKVVLDRAVHTQVLNAVGLAEKSHNVGLSSGFDYGGKLTDDAKDALLQAGFSSLAKAGRLPERDRLFSAEGVRLLAGALEPAVDQIFAAMEAQAERERAKEQWRLNKAVQENRWRI